MEQYPIHPLMDNLIQEFKTFSQLSFPRGIPDIQKWKDLIQGLTYYERLVIQRAQEYMSGHQITTEELICRNDFNHAIQSFKIFSQQDSDYMKKFLEYKNDLESISQRLLDCIEELGNPAKTMTQTH